MDTTLRWPRVPDLAASLAPPTAPAPSISGGRGLSPAWVVVVYAMAMAWVESAVVFYLRTMLDRIEPHQAHPLPLAEGFILAELVREAATMVMLLTVGWLAGKTWRSRIGYSLLAFGAWDIAYYLWLIPLTGWPRSLGDWDILFLIPLPWWGPVWAPMSIAALMIVFGVFVGHFDRPTLHVWPGRLSRYVGLGGAVVALAIFMADSLRCIRGGGTADQLRDVLPESFHWGWFIVAWLAMAFPVAETILRAFGAQGFPPALDSDRWLTHFSSNRDQRPEPEWNAPRPVLRPGVLRPLVRSLEQFRLGDGGGPASLIAFDIGAIFRSSDAARAMAQAWFKEEAEHARLLGCAVKRFGGRHITSHWSFTVFCFCRRILGARFELQVLTLTELVSTGYYRVLRRHSPDEPLTAMCTLILRDEAGHVAFQRARLAAAGPPPRGWARALWRGQFWVLGHAAATMLWVNHGPCLTALGGSRREYFREVRRELWRFMRSVEALGTCHAVQARAIGLESSRNPHPPWSPTFPPAPDPRATSAPSP